MILQNGKRIDGCSDTVPVGTLQPYLGLVPPKGYLVCQGQLVSKITYSKLYEICGDTFGTSTETHFYLPDLRGKTLAGYDENDTTMNTIGKLLGQKTHTHTSAAHTHTISGHVHSTGNHTLTVAEMPSHRHSIDTYVGMVTSTAAFALNDSNFDGLVGSDVMADGVNSKAAPSGEVSTIIGTTGGGGAHSHGDTGSTSLTTNSTTPGATGSNTNYQPTITVNWIVKAVMLIPDYIIVEDKLTSDSTVDALSARQGKLLNEKFTDYATKSEMIQYLPLSGGTMQGEIVIGQSDGNGIQLGTDGRINATVGTETNKTVLGIINEGLMLGTEALPMVMRGSLASPTYNGVDIVQSGSNSNGSYVRFFDGTLICTQRIAVSNVSASTSWGSLYVYDNGTTRYTFPYPFISEPIISITTGSTVASMGNWVADYGNRQVTKTDWKGWCLVRPTSAEISTVLNVVAVGRWK